MFTVPNKQKYKLQQHQITKVQKHWWSGKWTFVCVWSLMWTFRRPFGSVGGGEGCWHATPSAQVLVSGYHCPLKGTRDPWEKGSFQGWGRENTKGACFGKLTMAGSEEVLVKRWGWIGQSQKPAWGSHSRGTLKPVGEKDEEEQMSACARRFSQRHADQSQRDGHLAETRWTLFTKGSRWTPRTPAAMQRTQPHFLLPSCPKCTT